MSVEKDREALEGAPTEKPSLPQEEIEPIIDRGSKVEEQASSEMQKSIERILGRISKEEREEKLRNEGLKLIELLVAREEQGEIEKITNKELHNLITQRIYHEEALLQQRNYNFITTNVFLGAGFVVMATISTPNTSIFVYVIAVFGFLWALLQVAYGKLQVIETGFWRTQSWKVEDTLNTKFDRAFRDICENGETQMPFGITKMTLKKNKPLYKSFPYKFPFLFGGNVLFGVTVPWMMAAFWFALTIIMLNNHNAAWWMILPVAVAMCGLLLASCFYMFVKLYPKMD